MACMPSESGMLVYSLDAFRVLNILSLGKSLMFSKILITCIETATKVLCGVLGG